MSDSAEIVVVGPYPAERLERMKPLFAPRRFVHYTWDDPSLVEGLRDAEVAILGGDLDERILTAPNLKWVHCEHAGIEASARPEVFARGIHLTGAAGRSAAALAQHGFYFALALAYEVREQLRRQSETIWHDHTTKDLLALAGRTLGIIGYGNTGREMAALGAAFQMPIIVANRSGVAEGLPADARVISTRDREAFRAMIAESDVLMLACNLTDETYHLIDAELLGLMKPTSFLINLARGAVVDEAALAVSLAEGGIGGAGLDVFEIEPLPADSPLWALPNVLITPHHTPRLVDREERAFTILADNIRRYYAGEPLLNELTAADAYTGPIAYQP